MMIEAALTLALAGAAEPTAAQIRNGHSFARELAREASLVGLDLATTEYRIGRDPAEVVYPWNWSEERGSYPDLSRPTVVGAREGNPFAKTRTRRIVSGAGGAVVRALSIYELRKMGQDRWADAVAGACRSGSLYNSASNIVGRAKPGHWSAVGYSAARLEGAIAGSGILGHGPGADATIGALAGTKVGVALGGSDARSVLGSALIGTGARLIWSALR